MRFSTFHLFSQYGGQPDKAVYDREIQVIKWADELGFDTAWIAEHHFRAYGIVPNVMLLLGHLAGITTRVNLGSAIVIMPFHNPLRVAEDAAMVDLLSGGRLRFGFGRGYQGYEYHGFNLSMIDNRAVTDESMDIVRKAWTGKDFTHESPHFHVPELHVIPTPLQPRVPEVVASISSESVAHYGRRGVSFLVDSTLTRYQLRDLVQLWRENAVAGGFDPLDSRHVVMRLINITETDEEARALAQRGHILSYADRSARVFDPFLAFKDAPTAQERFAVESAPIDPVTGKIAAGYEYWEKGYLGRGPAEFDPTSDESWEERWCAGTLARVNRMIDEIEEIGFSEIICTFAGVNPRAGESAMDATYRAMAEFSEKVIQPRAARQPAPSR